MPLKQRKTVRTVKGAGVAGGRSVGDSSQHFIVQGYFSICVFSYSFSSNTKAMSKDMHCIIVACVS